MPPPPAEIVVVGSLNLDLLARVRRLPRPGETVPSAPLIRRFGGKGANQALAAARQGARVAMIGCLGADAEGQAYREHLAAQGVDCRGVRAVARLHTGAALIGVDDAAENQIIVAPGANAALTAADVRRQAAQFAGARGLLLQWEVPFPAIAAALALAAKASVPVIMNPSPWQPDFPWADYPVAFGVVNELEAALLLGREVGDLTPRRCAALRRRLADLRIETLVITRGTAPTLALSPTEALSIPTLAVKSVDTVGAGDAFTGVFAAAIVRGGSLGDALRRANAAGALATLKPGAQEALPTAAQVTRAARRL